MGIEQEMTSTELLVEGVELMLLGIGTVFVFLIMLVGCITAMSRLVTRYIPEKSAEVAAPRHMASAPPAEVDQQTLIAIGEAIRRHRARQAH
ncbi:hypothetical protein GCM10009083_06480 [Halopseudomonas pertucinogena]|uniref:Probable oxaloacetate decarboxylase gamma chain n=2 Tax=Halopseudomonas pertucinogena TaxID=86175 RepID=A0ABQ2CKF4_9GAMM|nr:hypothetical protein GCM10009083_06480 [Halopseudomonas pertucinogena]